MTNPSICCTGIDARRKKIDAIMEMVHTLKLANVKAIRTRAEDHTQQYEYVTARAVGYIQKLVPQLYHLIKKN